MRPYSGKAVNSLHHRPANILGFFGGKIKHQVFSPAAADETCVVGRLDMYRAKEFLYRTMVLLVRPTKVRR
jgi:hypothetical protein